MVHEYMISITDESDQIYSDIISIGCTMWDNITFGKVIY